MDVIPSYVFLILALALLAMAVGLGIWLFNYITGGGSESPSRERRERSPTTRALVEMETSVPAGARELLSVHRLERGELAVFVRGQRYYHLRGIKDSQLGTEAVEAIVRVMAFAEGWLPALRQQASRPSPTEPTVSPASPVDQEAFLERLRQSDLFPLETAPSSGLFGRRKKHKSSQPLEPLLTPADEINELVQQRLQERSDMFRQDISLTTGQDGGLCIRVGVQTFTEADDIPDPEVRAFIQDAIREWKEG